MRGGSRFGAGRPAWHAKTSRYLRLDVRDLRRRGLLKPGASFAWQWSRVGEQYASIGIRVISSYVVHLDFQRDGEPERVELDLEHTACRYGGERPWFTCPRCRRRVAIVYLARNPGCRKCLALRYPSQSGDAITRSWERTVKILRKLGQTNMHDIPCRPKGMRQTTFERLLAAWWREKQFRDDALAIFVVQHFSLPY